MKKKTIELENGQSFIVRELTYGELKAIREAALAPDFQQEMPLLMQLEKQGKKNLIDDMGISEIVEYVEEIYKLTFPPLSPPA